MDQRKTIGVLAKEFVLVFYQGTLSAGGPSRKDQIEAHSSYFRLQDTDQLGFIFFVGYSKTILALIVDLNGSLPTLS